MANGTRLNEFDIELDGLLFRTFSLIGIVHFVFALLKMIIKVYVDITQVVEEGQ